VRLIADIRVSNCPNNRSNSSRSVCGLSVGSSPSCIKALIFSRSRSCSIHFCVSARRTSAFANFLQLSVFTTNLFLRSNDKLTRHRKRNEERTELSAVGCSALFGPRFTPLYLVRWLICRIADRHRIVPICKSDRASIPRNSCQFFASHGLKQGYI
jgi:hypothetical protein